MRGAKCEQKAESRGRSKKQEVKEGGIFKKKLDRLVG
jgi:hypothetical protein